MLPAAQTRPLDGNPNQDVALDPKRNVPDLSPSPISLNTNEPQPEAKPSLANTSSSIFTLSGPTPLLLPAVVKDAELVVPFQPSSNPPFNSLQPLVNIPITLATGKGLFQNRTNCLPQDDPMHIAKPPAESKTWW